MEMELDKEKKKVKQVLKKCDKNGVLVKSKPQLINLCGCNPAIFTDDSNSRRMRFMLAVVDMFESGVIAYSNNSDLQADHIVILA